LPDPDPVSVIQLIVLEAVQAQPAWAVTAIVPVTVVAATISDVGARLIEQEPLCVTVNVPPATVIVPTRLAVVVLAATLYVAVPFPVPAPAVTVIHDAPLAAVQGQPAGAVTLMLPGPPEPANDWLDGDRETEHVAPAACCVPVNVAPAIVRDPVRMLVDVFASTMNDTDPFPVPAAPPITVIQLLLLTAVQLHQSAAVTVLVPTLPAEANDWLVGEIVGAHGPS